MRTKNQIEQYVEKFAPTAYSKIQNPETYFQQLRAELVEARNEATAAETMKPLSEAEMQNPLLAQGRVQRVQLDAWEELMRERVYDQFPAEVDEIGEPLETETPLPSDPSQDPALY